MTTQKVVVVTGCGGAAGRAVVRRLLAEGATVVGADSSAAALEELSSSLGAAAERFHGETVDLFDESATRDWAQRTLATHGQVDGVVHLVGGWRGGKTFGDNTMADSELLFSLLVRTLQTTTLAFHDALVASPSGRFVLVSATAAQDPAPGSASYAAAKAAAETWTVALAKSFAATAGADHGPSAAAVVLVVKALLTDEMRAAKPDAAFAGFTHVDDLAERIAVLWGQDATELNGAHVVLAP